MTLRRDSAARIDHPRRPAQKQATAENAASAAQTFPNGCDAISRPRERPARFSVEMIGHRGTVPRFFRRKILRVRAGRNLPGTKQTRTDRSGWSMKVDGADDGLTNPPILNSSIWF